MSKQKLIRIPGDTLIIDETEKEIKYRKKNFPDFKEVSEMKLLCTVCRKDVSRGIISGKKIFINNTLGVLVCGKCHSSYGDGCFSMDEDGDDKYCRWCGDGGSLYCCAKCICGFCRKCIMRNLNRTVMTDVKQDDWNCFVCHPEPLYALRSLCWAASKYYDYVNEKKDKPKKKDKQDDGKRSEMCDDNQNKRPKRGQNERKNGKIEKSDKKGNLKLALKKKKKETPDVVNLQQPSTSRDRPSAKHDKTESSESSEDEKKKANQTSQRVGPMVEGHTIVTNPTIIVTKIDGTIFVENFSRSPTPGVEIFGTNISFFLASEKKDKPKKEDKQDDGKRSEMCDDNQNKRPKRGQNERKNGKIEKSDKKGNLKLALKKKKKETPDVVNLQQPSTSRSRPCPSAKHDKTESSESSDDEGSSRDVRETRKKKVNYRPFF